MPKHPLRELLTRLGLLASKPASFAVVFAYAAAWFAFSRATFDWEAVATLATFLMTLLITRINHRDTQALHAKLDELLRAHGEARGELATLDDKEPEEIAEHRSEARAIYRE